MTICTHTAILRAENELLDLAQMKDLKTLLNEAAQEGKLLNSSLQNIELLLVGSQGNISKEVVKELAEAGEWGELNDRFYKTLVFGTGGLRGRTVGKIISKWEQGNAPEGSAPEFPCVGTACMNYFNLSRALRGLIAYVKKDLVVRGETRKPRLCFGHDTRFFSRIFAEFCAKVAVELGCDAWLFESARSTPELSFAIRQLNADSGVVLTASHNPYWDNGFKAYWNDGAQLVSPHDAGVIAEVNALDSEIYEPLEKEFQGKLSILGKEFDQEYSTRLKTLIISPELLEEQQKADKPFRLVFTNLHGTGGIISVPVLRELGIDVLTVKEQDEQNGRFPTVVSPNPENAPALAMAMELADKEGVDLVLGTDPDCDRMGVAVRGKDGKLHLLTGNQIGSLMAWYRMQMMFKKGWINDSNRSRAVMVKTFVTTPLQDALAKSFGVEIVNTLTGFKYIAEKLGKYEASIPADKRGDYRRLDEITTRNLRLEYSRFFVFGGEESYGYLGCDFVRDKDANGAAVMFAEVAAYARSLNLTLEDLLHELFHKYGVHLEKGESLVMEGAQGAAQIQRLAKSFAENPPKEVDGSKVIRVRNFAKSDIIDEEGDIIPRENMIFFDLEDGRSYAVRPSGTEPKIKFYLFAKGHPGEFVVDDEIQRVSALLTSLWNSIQTDISSRI